MWIGFGLDAQIAMRFHNLREKYPEQFGSQLQNKVHYGKIGAEAYFFANKDNIPHMSQVEFYCDGRLIDLTGTYHSLTYLCYHYMCMFM
jgi:diacylglycerol kinase (ATP)